MCSQIWLISLVDDCQCGGTHTHTHTHTRGLCEFPCVFFTSQISKTKPMVGIEEFFLKKCSLLINVCVGDRQESFGKEPLLLCSFEYLYYLSLLCGREPTLTPITWPVNLVFSMSVCSTWVGTEAAHHIGVSLSSLHPGRANFDHKFFNGYHV